MYNQILIYNLWYLLMLCFWRLKIHFHQLNRLIIETLIISSLIFFFQHWNFLYLHLSFLRKKKKNQKKICIWRDSVTSRLVVWLIIWSRYQELSEPSISHLVVAMFTVNTSLPVPMATSSLSSWSFNERTATRLV